MSATKHRGKKDTATAGRDRSLEPLQEQAESIKNQTNNQAEKQDKQGNKGKRQEQASELADETEEQTGE